jgi:diadenosine tetraphosphate (Ap4A) HIT family hydrolase
MECPFCTLPASRVIAKTRRAMVIRDAYPVSPGHTLILPTRHVGSFFALGPGERTELLDLLDQARKQLNTEFCPDAYNIGINDGSASGQTVPHVHIHLIPRYQGDCADPRGGVRWIVPAKADYWTPRESP